MLKLSLLLLLTCSLASFSQYTYAEESGFPETQSGDLRKIRTANSPEWLAAIGRFVSTLSATKKEQCSLSIVADHPDKNGIIAVTAGHCVDHWYEGSGRYRVGKNEVVFKSNSGKLIQRKITAVLKSEMHPGDYAIVKLNAAIKNIDIKPLLNAPYDYSDLLYGEYWQQDFKPYATMAGYSADKQLGQKGKVLTYHEKCRVNGGANGLKKAICYSYRGASGGPLVVTVAIGDEMSDEPWQVGVQSYFVGSIVGARGEDDHSMTMFTETTHYARTLDSILASH